MITHIVRSFDPDCHQIHTPHGSLADAQAEQARRREAHHRYVMVLAVEAFPLPLDRCNVPAWREVGCPAKRPATLRKPAQLTLHIPPPRP